MDFQTMIYNILLTIITTSMPVLIGFLVSFIKNHVSAKQLQTAKIIATNAVEYSNQVSKELGLDNGAKLNSALASAKLLAEKYGIKFSDEQWKNLIEPSVLEVKKGLNDLTKVSLPVVEPEPTQTVLNESTPVLEAPKESLIVSDDMMQETFSKIKEKAITDATNAVNEVISGVQKQLQL